MTHHYNRSEIYNFCELPEAEQNEILKDNTPEEAEEMSFVKYCHPEHKPQYLPLNMFIRPDGRNNFTHGIYGQTYFSAYFITLNKSNDEAVIAYKSF
jgi:hypothetical protein